MTETNPSTAQDCIQYASLWLSRHDPEFAKKLAGKNLLEVIPLLNERYGCSFDPDHLRASDFLFWLPIYINRLKEANKISARMREHNSKKPDPKESAAPKKKAAPAAKKKGKAASSKKKRA